jgi:hypothetical protein
MWRSPGLNINCFTTLFLPTDVNKNKKHRNRGLQRNFCKRLMSLGGLELLQNPFEKKYFLTSFGLFWY